jgi:hypothetical protein
VIARPLPPLPACRGAMLAAVLNVIGLPGDYLLARDVPGMPWYPALLSALIGIGLIVLLAVRRQQLSARSCSYAFLANTASILVALWITSGYWAATHPWTPFQANKLGALGVALLAQELWVGLVAIAGFAGMAIAKYYVLAPEIQSRFPVGEPWLILFYALFAGTLLAYRLRGVTLERERLHLLAEAAAVEKVARTVLLLRDYANTPIQNIVLWSRLIRHCRPDLAPLLGPLDRATEKLTALSRTLNRHEAPRTWREDDESPDGARLTRRLARQENGARTTSSDPASRSQSPGDPTADRERPELR